MFEPLTSLPWRPGENIESFRRGQQMVKELNLHMRLGYLDGRIEALMDHIKIQKRQIENLQERLARLEARYD